MSELRRADSVLMGDAARLDLRAPAGALRSRRVLRFAPDDRLAVLVQRGNDAAFEVAFERHAPAILGFCRHMLGSLEEAEDALQHTFAAAYRDLRRGAERKISLRPWLFTIARNRCLSVLRARRELPLAESEVATVGLAEQVEQRVELRQLLADVRELPDEQRAALLLAEVGGLPQADIASVLGCEVQRVKALVFRARSALVARREAREVACEEIREQLANLRGGALRRTELRLHLRDCPGCRDFREQVRRQRQMLSVALPVAPSLGLKASVLAAVGIGGGAAGGGAVAGSAAAAKLATVAVIAAGSVAGGAAVVEHERHAAPKPAPLASPPTPAPDTSGAADASSATDAGESAPDGAASGGGSGHGRSGQGRSGQARSGHDRSGHDRSGHDRSHYRHEPAGRGQERSGGEHEHFGSDGRRDGAVPVGQLKGEQGRGHDEKPDHENGEHGQGEAGRSEPSEGKAKPEQDEGSAEPKVNSGNGQEGKPEDSEGGGHEQGVE
jgi:RNA polymerase sigma factor (sigma-70 family)